MPNYKTLTGDPAQGAVPPGEYNVLEMLKGEYEALTGYTVEIPEWALLNMANYGIQTLAEVGQYMVQVRSFMAGKGVGVTTATEQPWADHGLTKDEYASASNIFATDYKKITGQDISPEALAAAFKNPRDPTGGLLTGTEYIQQLMNDTAIQKQFGWVKYGLDYSAWAQQKLSLRASFGRDINDAEAATILQYSKAASGSNMTATAKQGGQQAQQPLLAGGSVVR